MAKGKQVKARYDARGRKLRPGETVRGARYMFQYTDFQNKRKTLYANSLEELRAAEERIQADKRGGIDTSAGKVTIDAVFDAYRAGRKDWKEITRSNIESMYNFHIRGRFGARYINSVSPSDVDALYNAFLDAGLSAGTLKCINGILNPAFEWACRRELILRNPLHGIAGEVIRNRDLKTAPRRALSDSDLRRFFEFAEAQGNTPHYLHIIRFMLLTGCRIGEACALSVEDLDFDAGLIHIRKNLVRVPGNAGRPSYMQLGAPKTEAGKRLVPMTEETREILHAAMLHRMQAGGCNAEISGERQDFVFVSNTGGAMECHNINSFIRATIAAFNAIETTRAKREGRRPSLLPHFSCHTMRHTFASKLCEMDVNIKLIQSVLGHANAQTTLNIYAEYREEKQRAAIPELSKLIRFA